MTRPESLTPREAAKFKADTKRFCYAAAYWRQQIFKHGKSIYAQNSARYWRNKLVDLLQTRMPVQEASSAAEVMIKLAELLAEPQQPDQAAVTA